jgi:glycosyltransferase involved in cell wall biosynthesis
MEFVTGDYILWVDDDNVIYSNYLEIASKKLKENNNVGILIHKILHDEVGEIPKEHRIKYYDIDTLNFIVKTVLAMDVKWDEWVYWADFNFIKKCEDICTFVGLNIVYGDEIIGEHGKIE